MIIFIHLLMCIIMNIGVASQVPRLRSRAFLPLDIRWHPIPRAAAWPGQHAHLYPHSAFISRRWTCEGEPDSYLCTRVPGTLYVHWRSLLLRLLSLSLSLYIYIYIYLSLCLSVSCVSVCHCVSPSLVTPNPLLS